MSDKVMPGPITGNPCFSEAVCIHTKMIYDSCKSKECIADARVFFGSAGQAVVNTAQSVKIKKACVADVAVTVEPVPFNAGYFTVDSKYTYTLSADVYTGCSTCTELTGLAYYTKRSILYGGEGNARVFTSEPCCSASADSGCGCGCACPPNLPLGVVEAVDPIVLGSKLRECPYTGDVADFPSGLLELIGGEAVVCGTKFVFVTLGQFSVVRLERDAPLLVPTYEFSLPTRQSPNIHEEDPCDLFDKIKFPNDEFFPKSGGECRCDNRR